MLEKTLNPHILNVFLFLSDLKNVKTHKNYIFQGLMKNKKRLKNNFFGVFNI